jgi:ligand-binding sensor protein
MPEKSFSEAAQWFLKDFQKILDDFAQQTKFQVFLLDKEGNLITKMDGVQEACKLIISTEEGRVRCKDGFKMGFSLVRAQKKPIFTECYAGFALCWLPITIRGVIIGLIVVCGGRYDRGGSITGLNEKFSELSDELGIIDKKYFLKKAVDEAPLVTEEEVKEKIEKLTKLINILIENVQTPLKEVLG